MITLVPARAGQTQGLGIRYGKAVGTSIGEVAAEEMGKRAVSQAS